MKVFLGNAPWREGDRIGIRAGSRWPFTSKCEGKVPGYLPFPFFLAYATAVLEENNVEVNLVDALAEGYDNEEFVSELGKFDPDLVLLETSTPSIYVDLEIAKRIKERFGCEIALAGPHASVMYTDIMREDFVDYILVGEYEYTLLDLVKHLEKGGNLREVKGLVYRENEEMKVNERRPLIENLDDIPWPARHFLPMYSYNDNFAGMIKPNTQIWASRGCPFGCIFCLWPKVMYGSKKYRVRDPVKVVDEMGWLIDKYKFKSIFFDDDTFNIGKKRVIALANEIKERGIDVPWSIMASAQTMDKEMLEAMKKAGLVSLKYGVESGDQEILNRAKKGLDLNKLRDVVKTTKEMEIKTHLTFMFGLPGETWDTVRKTINFAFERDPDSIQFSICTPFPGTDYFEWVDKNGFLLTKDWYKYDGATTAVIRTEKMDKEDLEKAREMAIKTWKKYRSKKDFREEPLKYILNGFRHPVKGIKELWRLVTNNEVEEFVR